MRFLFQVVILGLIFHTLHRVFRSFQRQHRAKAHGYKPPPQKPAPFFIARILKLLDILKSSKPFTDYNELRALYEKYGHTFAGVSLTGHKTIYTVDERNVQAVHSTNFTEWLVGPMRWSGMHMFMGNGFITTDGPVWEHSRNLIKPSFHKDSISDLTSFEGHLSNMIKEIPEDGSTVDLQPLLIRMFYDTSSEFLLGKSIGVLTEGTASASAFWEAFQLAMRGCGLNLFAGPFKGLLPSRLTTDHFNAVHKFIDVRVKEVMQSKDEKTSGQRRSLLYDLIQQTNDPIEIRHQLVNALAAAQDTTPTLLSNVMFELSRRPGLWARIRDEALPVSPSPMTAESTKKLRLTHHVLLESLRLYTLFPNLGRMAAVDTVLPVGGGIDGSSPVHAPAGTQVMLDFCNLHRSEAIYGADAHVFDPDRWERVDPGPWGFMAFGGGPKVCLGQNKALAEAACVVVRLAQRFARVEARDERGWVAAQGLVARNANGCLVAFTE